MSYKCQNLKIIRNVFRLLSFYSLGGRGGARPVQANKAATFSCDDDFSPLIVPVKPGTLSSPQLSHHQPVQPPPVPGPPGCSD